MPLRLRPSHLQYPDAGWPPTDGRFSVLYGEIPVGSLNRIEHGPTKDLWEWSITVHSTGHGLTMQGTEGSKEFAVSAFSRPSAGGSTGLGSRMAIPSTPTSHRGKKRRSAE